MASDERAPLLGSRRPSSARSSVADETTICPPSAVTPPANWPFLALIIGSIVLLVDLGTFLAQAPLVRLFESIRCLEFYQQHDPSVIIYPPGGGLGTVPEKYCKIDPVQDTVATIIGWQQLWDAVPGVLLGVAYGALADKKGRKLVLFLALLGAELGALWIAFVCYFRFSLYLTWLSSAFFVIGGGGFTASAVMLAMTADVVPANKRTSVFLYIHSGMIVGNMIGPAMSSILMEKSPWPPIVLGFIVEGSAIFAVMLLPETKDLKIPIAIAESGDSGEDLSARSEANKSSFSSRQIKKLREATGFMFRDITLAMIIFTAMIVTAGIQAMFVLLQFVPKKFGWTIAQAALLNSLRSAVELFVSVALLPCISWLALNKLHMKSERSDLWIARGSSVIVTLGFFLVGIAPTAVPLIIGLALTTAVGGFTAAMRSVATTMVGGRRSADIGKLYSMMGILSAIGGLVAGPPYASAFKWGMHAGRAWYGLPFLITAAMYSFTVLATAAVRLPKAAEGDADEDEDGEGCCS